MTLLNAFKKENRSIHKCPACGMDLNFSEDTLLRMVACPFCAARIDLKEVLQRTEISYVVGYFVNRYGKDVVERALTEMGLCTSKE